MMATKTKKPARSAATVAADKLETISRRGYSRPDMPTPQRLLKSIETAKVRRFTELVEKSFGDRFDQVRVSQVRIDMGDDSPLGRLVARGSLDKNRDRNMILGAAGQTYYRFWYESGMEGLKSCDMTREVRGTANGGLFSSERQCASLQLFQAARAKIPPDYVACVNGIVLDQRSVVEVGRQIGSYVAEKQAFAVALHDLRRGLTALAFHFGILSHSDARKMEPA